MYLSHQRSRQIGRMGALMAVLLLSAGTAQAQVVKRYQGCQPGCQPNYGCQTYNPCYCPPGCHHPSYPEHAPPREPWKGEPSGKADPKVPGKKGDNGEDTPPDAPEDQPEFDFSTPDATTGMAMGAGGANSTIIGRSDQNNRLNLFDTMSAQPMNRVWFTYQRVGDYNIGIAPDQANVPTVLFPQQREDQNLFRAGAELMLSCCTSVAFQAQSYTGDVTEDDFTNPQIMLKHILCCDCCSLLSGTFGIQPEYGSDVGAINENTTRLYPGLLYYRDLGCGWFFQDGIQFGLPTETNQVYTFDWAASLGHWLYRHCSMDGGCGGCGGCCGGCGGCGCCGCGGCGCCGCCQPTICGVVAQVEILGKHVLNDTTIVNPFRADPFNFGGAAGDEFFFEEDRHVIDLTTGISVVLSNNVWVTGAVSVSLTGSEVRREEFISSVSYRF